MRTLLIYEPGSLDEAIVTKLATLGFHVDIQDSSEVPSAEQVISYPLVVIFCQRPSFCSGITALLHHQETPAKPLVLRIGNKLGDGQPEFSGDEVLSGQADKYFQMILALDRSFEYLYGNTSVNSEMLLESISELRLEISALKITEENLRHKVQFSESVIQTSPLYYLTLDCNLRILSMNHTLQKALNVSEGGVYGRSFNTMFVPEDEQAEIENCISAFVKSRDRSKFSGRLKALSGAILDVDWTLTPVTGADQTLQYAILMGVDITDNRILREARKVAQIKLKQAKINLFRFAFYDGLTGLPNRTFFIRRLQKMMKTVNGVREERFSVFFLDFDHFKLINDSLGHIAGDMLLLEVARRLRQSFDGRAIVARVGGDEFAVLDPDRDTPEKIAAIGEKVCTELARPYNIRGQDIFGSISMGAVLFHGQYETPEEMLRDADTAMFRAKERGRNNCQLYSSEFHLRAVERLQFENNLRYAIERDEFFLVYQPKVDLRTKTVCGLEALLRWETADGIVPPDKFIPIAEESGVIIPLGEWVLRQAARQIRNWLDQGRPAPPVAINLSPNQFYSRNLAAIFLSVMQEYGLLSHQLSVEITEGVMLNDSEQTQAILEEFINNGISVSIDDFGTGYSSLGYLKKYDIDYIKIDRSFVSDILRDEDDVAICSAIIAMGHRLGMRIVAEGVETEEQLKLLEELGCDEAQGYLFSRPVIAAELSF